MRKALLLLPFIIALCGLTQAPFDANSVPKARAARKVAIDACSARTDFKSSTEVVDCVMMADSDFAHAIRLNDSKILGDYIAGVKSLDADNVAGTLKPGDIAKRFQLLQGSFFKAMDDRYAEYETSMTQDMVNAAGQPHASPGMGNMGMMNNMNGMGY
jgi:hypothetical protein